jgi:hypothetical protein
MSVHLRCNRGTQLRIHARLRDKHELDLSKESRPNHAMKPTTLIE